MPQLAEYTYPTQEIANEAAKAARAFQPILAKKKAQHITVTTQGSGHQVVVPRAAFELLVRLLTEMAAGHAVTILPMHAELTTQQAAELLNVSRPHVIKLLDEGRIPHRMVGSHRRIRFEDLRRFKEIEDTERRAAVDELTAEAERLNLDF
ncbi:MAG TPA: helix-turn-helix domain-containing protein [Anaeromyxobacteraceae bacterium]|nr:helix-turn-helix domain-containing protein [Anaeromyxobacteraceae bacterium]